MRDIARETSKSIEQQLFGNEEFDWKKFGEPFHVNPVDGGYPHGFCYPNNPQPDYFGNINSTPGMYTNPPYYMPYANLGRHLGYTGLIEYIRIMLNNVLLIHEEAKALFGIDIGFEDVAKYTAINNLISITGLQRNDILSDQELGHLKKILAIVNNDEETDSMNKFIREPEQDPMPRPATKFVLEPDPQPTPTPEPEPVKDEEPKPEPEPTEDEEPEPIKFKQPPNGFKLMEDKFDGRYAVSSRCVFDRQTGNFINPERTAPMTWMISIEGKIFNFMELVNEYILGYKKDEEESTESHGDASESAHEYTLITWVPGIPCDKYAIYRDGIIINRLSGKRLIADSYGRVRLTTTKCIAGEKNSGSNKTTLVYANDLLKQASERCGW